MLKSISFMVDLFKEFRKFKVGLLKSFLNSLKYSFKFSLINQYLSLIFVSGFYVESRNVNSLISFLKKEDAFPERYSLFGVYYPLPDEHVNTFLAILLAWFKTKDFSLESVAQHYERFHYEYPFSKKEKDYFVEQLQLSLNRRLVPVFATTEKEDAPGFKSIFIDTEPVEWSSFSDFYNKSSGFLVFYENENVALERCSPEKLLIIDVKDFGEDDEEDSFKKE